MPILNIFWPMFTTLLLNLSLPSPISGQATCGFISSELSSKFPILEVPIEPQPVNDLSICRPSSPTCCTSKIELEFLRIAKSRMEERIKCQIRVIRAVLEQNAQNFRAQLKMAINGTSAILARLFHRTYGHFFVQNKQIFDEFFLELSAQFGHEICTENFNAILQKFFQRIYVAEFALLNPMRPVSEKVESCLLDFFPILRPFGAIPGTISNLLGRTFRLWSSLICALDNSAKQLDQLEKLFSLPEQCGSTLVQMQFCQLCSHESILHPACPNFCKIVLKNCLNDLEQLHGQWNQMIESLLHLTTDQLQSAHNPHTALHPLPVQISEAIMYFQEKGHLLSSRIIFRCFGQNFQKLLSERKKREIEEITNQNWTETSNELLEKEEGEDGTAFYLLDFQAIQSTRQSVDQFRDELLRLKDFWTTLAQRLCQEGGIQAKWGEFCWNGTTTGKYRGKLAQNQILTNRNSDKYASIRFAFYEIAQRLATQNGLIIDAFEKPSNNKSEDIMLPADDEDYSFEGSGNDEDEEENYWWENDGPEPNQIRHFATFQMPQWRRSGGGEGGGSAKFSRNRSWTAKNLNIQQTLAVLALINFVIPFLFVI